MLKPYVFFTFSGFFSEILTARSTLENVHKRLGGCMADGLGESYSTWPEKIDIFDMHDIWMNIGILYKT